MCKLSDTLINQILGLLAFCGFVGIPLVLEQRKEIDKLQKEIQTLTLTNKLLVATLKGQEENKK